MAFTTYANQKSVCIHKPAVRSNFLQIANNDWMEVNKTLTPYRLQLYLYLASNADGFNLELSPQHAENAAGIRRTTFYEYLRKLEINGYLVWRRSNHYDFYTTPRPAEERTHPDHHNDYIMFELNSPCESTITQHSCTNSYNVVPRCKIKHLHLHNRPIPLPRPQPYGYNGAEPGSFHQRADWKGWYDV